MSPRLTSALLALFAAIAAPASASALEPLRPSDVAFVKAFQDACIPGRLSYQGTKDAAAAAGWTEVADDADAELAALMKLAREAMTDPEYPTWKGEAQVFTKQVAERDGPHYLVVTYLVAPDVINMIGCNLYDFAATEIVSPGVVTDALDAPFSHSVREAGLENHVWGPPCTLPRTFDTHLTLVEDGSAASEFTGFSGLMLKFETSEPAPGEVVPETYC